MTTTINERDLVLKLRDAKARKEEAELTLEAANKECAAAEAALIESLTARNAEATARYDGVGYCGLVKPRLYASFRKEFEPQVFEYLKTQGREDLIKATVNAQSLSGFVGEMLSGGKALPEFITYYLKQSVRFYNK